EIGKILEMVVRNLFVSTWRLFSWWARGDRIRVSPRDGRLLRLTRGCYVRVAGKPAKVMSRQIARCAEGLFVAYDCESAAGPFQLTVRHDDAAGAMLRVRSAGVDRAVDEADVEVIPRRGDPWFRPLLS